MASYLRLLLATLLCVAVLVFCGAAVAEGTVPNKSDKTYTMKQYDVPYTGDLPTVLAGASQAFNNGNTYNVDGSTGCPGRQVQTGSYSWVSEANGTFQCKFEGQIQWVTRGTVGVCATKTEPARAKNIAAANCGTYTTIPFCPPNAALVNGVCTCSTGYSPDATGNSCDKSCEKGKVVSEGYYDIGPNAGATPQIVACAGNCRAYFNGDSPAGSAVVGGAKHWFAKGYYSQGGEKCSTAQQQAQPVGTGTANRPEDTCAANQGSIKMNGKTVCVDQNSGNDKPVEDSKDKSSTKTEKTSQTNPDGSTTVTETTTKTDSNGNKETTVTKTTTGTDGKVTTESETSGSTKPPTTGGTDDGTDEEPKGECEKNPSKAGCGGEAAPVGTLYTPKDKTFSGVLTAHRNSFMSSSIGSAVGGFFVVSSGGSCPTWNAQIPFIKADVKIDQFCSTWAVAALAILKTAILVAASFFAFRVAVE